MQVAFSKCVKLTASAGAALWLGACATADVEPAPAIAAPDSPPAPVYGLDDFLNAAPAEIDARLGPPALTRKEGEGEYRRYRLKTCTLVIILYPDDAGAVRARHVEATALTSAQEKPNLDDCLAAG